jgi:hypothetical protein
MSTDLLHKFANLENDKFKDCSFRGMKIGDIVASWTMTNSQKYIDKPGYEECNMIKYGMLLSKNEQDPSQSQILCYDKDKKRFHQTHFYFDVGTSGSVILMKYHE